MTAPTTGLGPSSTVNFMVLELVGRKFYVAVLTEGGTQRARRRLQKESTIILHVWKREAKEEGGSQLA